MKYEIIIEEREKTQKFYKAAISEYEKRLSRYCKISHRFVKKEKEVERLWGNDDGRLHFLILPGNAEMTSEELSQKIGDWENAGVKGVVFFILAPSPEGADLKKDGEKDEEKSGRLAQRGGLREAGSDSILVLSDFTLPAPMAGMILCEQIYRGYRILHNHPYHK